MMRPFNEPWQILVVEASQKRDGIHVQGLNHY